MSKSAGSGEFNAAVCRKQSLFKQTQRYMQERRIWLLILFYDQLLLIIEDSDRRLKILRQLLTKH